MKYLLDTNACIHYLNGHPQLVDRVLIEGPRHLGVSALTVAELHFGAARSHRQKANLARVRAFLEELRVEPFSEACAVAFGRLKSEFARIGSIVADFDIGIAATALITGCSVVSSDRDLHRMRGIEVEDWTELG